MDEWLHKKRLGIIISKVELSSIIDRTHDSHILTGLNINENLTKH